MSNVNSQSQALVPRTLDEVRSLSAQFAKSALLPADLRGKEADVFVTILAGQELGMPPMAALRGIHVVKGKPILSADSMVGVVLGRGIARYFRCVEESPTSVTYETLREGSPEPQRCTWTMEDAKRAGLDGDNWRKYPRAMLKARCKAALARDVYPDVLAGCYEESESDEVRGDARPAKAIDAEVVAETKTPKPAQLAPPQHAGPDYDAIAVQMVEALGMATTMDEIRIATEIGCGYKAMPKGSDARAKVYAAYKAATDGLEAAATGAA